MDLQTPLNNNNERTKRQTREPGMSAERCDSNEERTGADELAVHALTTAEALVVWGIRHWVACLKARTDPIPLMEAGFGSGRIAAAVRPLEAMLVITLDSATVPRDVRCIHCATVGDGERDLLAAIAFEQAGYPAETVAKLREWLPPASARLAKDLVAEIAQTLHYNSLRIPLRREYGALPRHGIHRDLRTAAPASLSVH
jgi:hypothetical protein